MGFSLKSLFGLLIYVLWPFSVLSVCTRKSFIIRVLSKAFTINVFWITLSGSRLCNDHKLILDKKEKSSIFNFVLG